MMKYFEGFVEALSSVDLTPVENRAYATEGPELSFGHLDDRTFEVLAYRLLSKRAAKTSDRVTLMQGVGERGRDVVCYRPDGRLSTIVQCKLLKDRLTYPDLLRELLKLALHRVLDPSIIEPGVVYEIWAPGGFAERAAQLVDTWPHGWTEEATRERAQSLIDEYAAFKSLTWEAVRDSVLHFPEVLALKKRSGHDISVLVRGATEIFDDFFIAKHVMDVGAVRRELKSILAEERAAAAAPPPPEPPQAPAFFHPRPAPLSFTGREATLAEARKLLGTERILVLAGTGGIGKSAVALRLAEEAVAAGVATYWLDGAHLDQQLAMLAFALKVPWSPAKAQPLIDALESQRACVVLDGLTFTAEVRGIPRPSSRVSVIATTRERGIVPLLPHPATLIDVSVLTPGEAADLLKRLVGVPFPWTDQEVDQAARICGYLPLALVLIASALRRNMTPCDALLKQLAVSPIVTLDANATPEQPGIQSTFALAVARLSEEERIALVALSVCAPATWVDVVAYASEQPRKVTERALSTLESISLVERHPSLGLWAMHDVVRYLCQRQPEAQQFAFRHAIGAMRQAEDYRRLEDWAYLEANLGEIFVAAERLAKSGFAEEVGATVRELIPHLRERGLHGRRTYVIRYLAEQLIPMLPKKALSRAYFIGQLGLCAYEEGDAAGAERALQQSLRLYKTLGSRIGEVSTLANMAAIDEDTGNIERAVKRFRQAADIFQAHVKHAPKKEKLQWRKQGLIAQSNLARLELRRGNRDVALIELDAILRASKDPELRDVHARALWFKSTLLWQVKREAEALELGRLAILEFRDVGLASELLAAMLEHAERALVAGFPSNALQAAEHASDLGQQMADFDRLSYALSLQSVAYRFVDKEGEATKFLAAARDAARAATNPDVALERIDRLEARIKPIPTPPKEK